MFSESKADYSLVNLAKWQWVQKSLVWDVTTAADLWVAISVHCHDTFGALWEKNELKINLIHT